MLSFKGIDLPFFSLFFFVLKRKQVGWAAYAGQPTGGGDLQCALRASERSH